MLDLDAVIRCAASLEPPPSTVTRLAELVSNDGTRPAEISELIAHDLAMTAVLLRTANSAAWGGRSEISSVYDAIVRIGYGQVLSIAMSFTVRKNVTETAGEEADAIWRHAMATAIAAEEVRSAASVDVPSEAYTAALLHDIGKMVLTQFRDPTLMDACREGVEAGLSPLDAEFEALGVEHAELGALITQRWNLPTPMVLGIRCHHAPMTAAESALVIDPDLDGNAMTALCCAIHVADVIAHRAEGDEPGTYDLAALELLGLQVKDLDALVVRVEARLSDLLGAFAA